MDQSEKLGELLSSVQFTETGFSKGTEKEVLNRCMVVADLADKYVDGAGDYKIDTTAVAKLRKLIGEYSGMPEHRDNNRNGASLPVKAQKEAII